MVNLKQVVFCVPALVWDLFSQAIRSDTWISFWLMDGLILLNVQKRVKTNLYGFPCILPWRKSSCWGSFSNVRKNSPTSFSSWKQKKDEIMKAGTICRLGIAEVMGSNPVQAWIFFRLNFRNCLSCVYNCDDLSLIHQITILCKEEMGYSSCHSKAA